MKQLLLQGDARACALCLASDVTITVGSVGVMILRHRVAVWHTSHDYEFMITLGQFMARVGVFNFHLNFNCTVDASVCSPVQKLQRQKCYQIVLCPLQMQLIL